MPIFPGVLTSVLAGLMRMSLLNFFIFGLLGSAFRVFFMGMLGWYANEMYVYYAQRLEAVSNWFTLIFMATGTIGYFLLKKKIGKLI